MQTLHAKLIAHGIDLARFGLTLAEKLHSGEDRHDALARALAEELAITHYRIVTPFTDSAGTTESPSFPGLRTEYAVTRVAVLIDPVEYKADYREDQPDKSTFFVWQVIADEPVADAP